MKTDPIVRATRNAREEIYSPFLNNPQGFFRYLKTHEENYRDRLRIRPPQEAIKRVKEKADGC